MLVKWSEQETELGVIGRVGENNTRKIEIDCAETLEKLPGAEIICVMLRPGDETPYTLPLEANGNKRTIVLTDTDLERRGTIRIELRAVEGGAVLKSAILRGTVADSIRGEGDAPGQPVRDVLDRVDDTLKAAEATRKELETTLNDVQNKLESGAFDGKDGLDAPQIDDTTISDAAPWSSQHIVDMLCPPLTESGNPVVCYPVAGSKLGIKASWEPTQEGEGTPSQENIRPIHGRDSVSITRQEDELSMTLTLPSSVYGGEVGADGNGEKTWKVLTLTGKEPCHIFDTFFYVDFYKEPSFASDPAADYNSGKSSHYIYQLYGESQRIGMTTDGESATYNPANLYALTADGLAAWKSYLAAQYAAGTPVQIAYKLATPIPFTATGGGTVKALASVNTILTDADALTITGRADPIHIIQQLQAASAASAQALEDDTMEITQEEAIQEENEKGMNE